jgi:hypothetical protein
MNCVLMLINLFVRFVNDKKGFIFTYNVKIKPFLSNSQYGCMILDKTLHS